MDFETRPLAELPRHIPTRRPRLVELPAFAELPLGIAMFVRRGSVDTVERRRNSITQALRNNFAERQIHSLIDREKDGVWVWWEARR